MNTLLKKLSGWLGRDQTAPSHSSLPNSRIPQQSMLHDGSESATRGQLVQVLLRDLLRRSGMPPGWVQCQIQVMNSRSRGQGIYVRLVVKHWDERLMKYAFAFQKTLLTDIVQFEPKATGWLHGISWQLEVASTCPLTELPAADFWQTPAARAEPVDPFEIVPMPANPVPVATPAPVAAVAPVAVPQPVAAAIPLIAPTLPDMPVAAAMAAMPVLDGLEPLPALIDMPAAPVDDTAQDLERLFAIRDNELASLAKDNLLPVGYESTEPLPLQRG
jgi:hypothetical protein